MPITRRSYRSFEGEFRRRWRWWIVLEQELRVLNKSKIFMGLMLVALLHCLVRLLMIVAYDVVIQDPNNPFTPLLRQVHAITVNERAFFDFLRLQSPILLIIMLFAGSGMICNDLRNNLMEVYFSKPIRWWDYAVGKFLALVLIGLSITAIPGIFLVILHNALVPGMETFYESYWWPAAITGFSLAIIIPTALSILACSALLRSQGYASIAVFMVLIANSTFGVLLAELLRERNYLFISYPMALNRLGQHFFLQRRLFFNLPWWWSLIYVLVITVVAGTILIQRSRREEMAS